MAKIELTLTVLSPMFIYGAYQRGDSAQPELRAQSVRGQLRYWLRAVLGARAANLKQVWEAESAIFGSTGMGSAVSVRLYSQRAATAQYPMLPHRQGSGKPVSPAEGFEPETQAVLELVTRPGIPLPDDALHALKVWSLLGGLGKRSRRMFGAVRLTSQDAQWYPAPQTVDDFMSLVHNALGAAVGSPRPLNRDPEWPTLHPGHSWVVVGWEAYDSAEEANQALFSLLRGPYRSHERSFGHAMGGRRASPLHAQVRRVGPAYYPVLTALRAGPPDRDIRWDVVGQFMRDAKQQFNGETVWGGW